MKFTTFYLLAFIFILLGIFFRFQHLPGGKAALMLGTLATLFYIIIGLREIYKSGKTTEANKMIWTVAFILFSFFTGFIYLFKRKDVI